MSKRVITGAKAREGARVTENGPEVEAINGPKQRQKRIAELVEPPSVGQGFFLRQAQGTVDCGPDRRRRQYRIANVWEIGVRVGILRWCG
ncbi:hypothetical protein V6N11_044250 [Hibiscus sabdariffa]|uniref:Uncharacterized protein n=1 Tax=Hibiscus sabdariffa TaxID=183260 RepID=A0ABR2RER3_9ROSI